MELYLDTANLDEIREAYKPGFPGGLTTTPSCKHCDGIKAIACRIPGIYWNVIDP